MWRSCCLGSPLVERRVEASICDRCGLIYTARTYIRMASGGPSRPHAHSPISLPRFSPRRYGEMDEELRLGMITAKDHLIATFLTTLFLGEERSLINLHE